MENRYLSGSYASIMIFILFCTTIIPACLNAQDICKPVGWATQNGGVTGGGNGTPVVVSNYTDLKSAITTTSVKVVHVSGIITIPSGGVINFQDQTGKTLFGLPGSKLVSNDLTAAGSGILYVKRCSNVIIQNMTFEGPAAYDVDGRDNITIDNSTNLWIDHCEFQDGLDGNLDIKNAADYISVTWCKFIYNKAPIAGGPGGSADHRFSNLFGSGDDAIGDRGKLRITMQNCWWAQGCKSRMPRVRFGKVHMVNNYFNSTASSYCIQAGFEADILVEGNVFENVKTPIDLMNNTFTAVTQRNNTFTNISGNTAGGGTAFTPPYSLSVASAGSIVTPIKACAGATLPAAGSCSSCSTTQLSATLTKGGAGSSSQTINLGEPILNFYYTWTNASSVNITGVPASISAILNTTNKTVAFSGTPSQAGVYNYTVTTVGGNPNANASGTFTVNTVQNRDCNGDISGTAYLDNCGVCVGGKSIYKACTGNVEAETACRVDGFMLESTNAGFSGEGYVNTTNAMGASSAWYLNSSQAQTATLTFRYANGGTTDRGGRVSANGLSAFTLSLPATGGWTNWRLATINLNLSQGRNELLVEATTADGLANLDLIHFSAGVSPGGCLVTGISKSDIENIFIYPNPTNGGLHLSEIADWKLLDMMGQELESDKSGNTINLSVYPSGLYYVLINGQSHKIVKN